MSTLTYQQEEELRQDLHDIAKADLYDRDGGTKELACLQRQHPDRYARVMAHWERERQEREARYAADAIVEAERKAAEALAADAARVEAARLAAFRAEAIDASPLVRVLSIVVEKFRDQALGRIQRRWEMPQAVAAVNKEYDDLRLLLDQVGASGGTDAS